LPSKGLPEPGADRFRGPIKWRATSTAGREEDAIREEEKKKKKEEMRQEKKHSR
jgi:hypothetical protein